MQANAMFLVAWVKFVKCYTQHVQNIPNCLVSNGVKTAISHFCKNLAQLLNLYIERALLCELPSHTGRQCQVIRYTYAYSAHAVYNIWQVRLYRKAHLLYV